MKELSIEEKAKAYDKAIEKAKEMIKAMTNIGGVAKVDDIQYLFPELKESEDEKTRKELLEHCINRRDGKQVCVDASDYRRWADWLFRQGVENIPNLKSDKEISNEIIKFLELPHPQFVGKRHQEEWIAWLEKQGKNNMGISEATKQELKDNLNKALAKETPESWNEFLDEQKLADKVEPKFSAGDWVIDEQGIIDQITDVIENVTNHTYGYDTLNGEYFNDYMEGVRLWTIQDAKDGDVLAYNDGSLAIFRYRLSGLDAGLYMSHVILVDKIELKQTCAINNVHPATKEQRDTLMKAMADAGYTFDFERRELKKIENETEIPFGAKDSELQGASYHIPEGFHAEIKGNKVVIKQGEQKLVEEVNGEDYGIDGLYAAMDILNKTLGQVEGYQSDDGILEHKAAMTAVRQLYKQKPAWSEEDEEMSRFIGNAITADGASEYLESKGIQVIDAHVWLDGLKDRVQPQPKQEWSVEDDILLNDTIYTISEGERFEKELKHENCHDPHTYQVIISWLKSLKDRVLSQPKQEWNEGDEYYRGIIMYCLNNEPVGVADKKNAAAWLKSLRPQNWTKEDKERYISCLQRLGTGNPEQPETINSKWFKEHVYPQSTWKPSDEHYELEEFAKIVRGNLTGISKAVQQLFEAKYLQLTGNKMYGGFKD